jgi:hypothetical protein
METCNLCPKSFKALKSLTRHIRTKHSTTPYIQQTKVSDPVRNQCIYIPTDPSTPPSFTSVQESKQLANQLPGIVESTVDSDDDVSLLPKSSLDISPTPTSEAVTPTSFYAPNDLKLLSSPAQLRLLTVSDTGTTSFEKWQVLYTSQRGPGDKILSEVVGTKVLQFVQHNVASDKMLTPLAFRSSEAFDDRLDVYINTELTRGITNQTLVLRLRYLLWYISYLLHSDPDIPDDVYWLTADAVHEIQRKTTVAIVNEGLLPLLDPLPFVRVHEHMATILRKEQHDTLDPFILAFYQGCKTENECIQFGFHHLRCWLVVALRTWNVPCRIQIDTNLEAPTLEVRSKYVARLQPAGAYMYKRVINQDKVAGFSEATEIPCDPVCSAYMHFYLTHCRPMPKGLYVFQNQNGNKWIRASRDIKVYLEERGLQCRKICPNHRFVHFTRKVGLAVFALRHDLNEQKIREYAVLMRHSMETIQQHYATFLKYQMGKRATLSLQKICGHALFAPTSAISSSTDNNDVTELLEPLHFLDPYPGALRPVLGGLATCLRKEMADTFTSQFNVGTVSQGFSKPYYTVRDATTQTEDDSVDQVQTYTVGKLQDSQKLCLHCNSILSVFGPCAKSREQSSFGRFFLACKHCTVSGPQWKDGQIFFDIGIVPPKKTSSPKPRNLSNIIQYIRTVTTNVCFNISYWDEVDPKSVDTL